MSPVTPEVELLVVIEEGREGTVNTRKESSSHTDGTSHACTEKKRSQ